MRATWSLVAALAVCLGGVSMARGQEAPPPEKPAAAAESPRGGAGLRWELHRAVAELIEAQAAEKPDAQKIKELGDQVRSLREQVQANCPAGPWAGPGLWCPRGGPGMGFGPAWGGGAGRGPARLGRGYGRGFGPARGPGWGAGRGMGLGGAGAFIDQDRDGICDNYARLWGQR